VQVTRCFSAVAALLVTVCITTSYLILI